MRRLALIFAVCLAAPALAHLALAQPASAQEREISIELYLQPDDTGDNTLNKSVEIDDDDELTIEESRDDGANHYIERDATEDEIAVVEQLVRERIEAISLTPSEDVDAPRVEIQFEFETGAGSIEVEEIYPVGEVPDVYIEIQELFFEDVFR